MDNIVIYCDGGSRGNPGEAAYGFVVFNNEKKVLYAEGKRIGIATNNVAEYTAVVKALQWVKENDQQISSIAFFFDSTLVTNQLKGHFKVKNEGLRAMVFTIKKMGKELGIPISYQSVPRELNKDADRMVNLALDNQI